MLAGWLARRWKRNTITLCEVQRMAWLQKLARELLVERGPHAAGVGRRGVRAPSGWGLGQPNRCLLGGGRPAPTGGRMAILYPGLVFLWRFSYIRLQSFVSHVQSPYAVRSNPLPPSCSISLRRHVQFSPNICNFLPSSCAISLSSNPPFYSKKLWLVCLWRFSYIRLQSSSHV